MLIRSAQSASRGDASSRSAKLTNEPTQILSALRCWFTVLLDPLMAPSSVWALLAPTGNRTRAIRQFPTESFATAIPYGSQIGHEVSRAAIPLPGANHSGVANEYRPGDDGPGNYCRQEPWRDVSPTSFVEACAAV